MGSILDTPVKYDRGDFFSLMSLSLGASVARQNIMGELVIADKEWRVDIRERRIYFGENAFACGILGRETGGAWIWGWADAECGLPEAAFASARRIKRILGDVREFSAEKFMLDPLRTGHSIAAISTMASGENVCYYRCPFDDGAFVVQVNGLPDEVFAPLSRTQIMRGLIDVISAVECDHKLTAAGLLYDSGVPFEDGGSYIEAHFPDSNGLRMVFDDCNGVYRVLDIGGTL